MKGSSRTTKLCNLAAGVLLFFVAPFTAFAADASIFLSPITGTYNVGQQVTIVVRASSGGQHANGIEARLMYDPKILSIDGVGVAGTVITSWIQKPQVDEELGEISFIGAIGTSTVLDNANLVSLLVTPVRSGVAHIRFDREAITVNAADGTGGNILSDFKSGQYIIVPKDGGPVDLIARDQGVSVPVESGEVLGAATGTSPHVIEIVSTTHPDQNMWYNASSTSLRFGFPEWAKNVRLGFDKKQYGHGEMNYPAPVPQKTIGDLEDGEWYAHASTYATSGELYEGVYRIRVDRTPPSDFTATEEVREDETDPNIAIRVVAVDGQSGIDHYMFSIDGEDASPWTDDGTHVYRFLSKTAGVHELTATVYDIAGNSLSKKLSYNVKEMDPPSLTLTDEELHEGDRIPLDISGLPSGNATIYIQHGDESPLLERVVLDREGKMEFETVSRVTPGVYHVWSTVTDERGATSKQSSPISFQVSPGIFGLIARHPVIPAGIGTLFVFALFLFVWFRRLDRAVIDHDQRSYTEPESEFVYDEVEIENDTVSPHVPIVLGRIKKEEAFELPPPVRLA